MVSTVPVSSTGGTTAASAPRSTVLIPLHRSLEWLPLLEQNIRALSAVASVLVSDVSRHDDALELLRARIGDNPNVRFASAQGVESGWVAHCNWLLACADTEFVMWLAHDDRVSPEWIAEGERALDADAAAVLAVGRLIGLRDGSTTVEHPVIDYAAPDAQERITAALHRLFVGEQDGLGHAFRGLVRRSRSVPLPAVDAAGTKADMYWALTLLVRGPFVAIDADYEKTWHASSASAAWAPITVSPDFRSLLPAALRELPDDVRERLLLEAWTAEARALRAKVAAQRRVITRLRQESTRSLLSRARARLREAWNRSR